MKRGQRNLEKNAKKAVPNGLKESCMMKFNIAPISEHFSTPTDSPSDRGSPGKQCTDYLHRNEQE